MSRSCDRIRMRFRSFCEEYQIGKLLVSLGAVAAIWLVAALVICCAERRYADRSGTTPGRFGNLGDCLWSATVYLVSGLEEFEPQSIVSKVAAVTVMVAGVGALGMVGARLAASFVERARRKGLLRRLPRGRLRGHIVLCGWPANGERLLAELRAACDATVPIVVIDESAETIRLPGHRAWPGVWGIAGDPSDDEILRIAQVEQAHSAIVSPCDDGAPRRHERARELMIVLALRAVAPRLHITVPAPAERSLARILSRQQVELPIVHGVSSRLIGHACQRHFLTGFFDRLLACGDGSNSVHDVPLPEALVGHTFLQIQRRFCAWADGELTLVGIRRDATGGGLAVNPRRTEGRSAPLTAGDRLLVLARHRPDFRSLPHEPSRRT